MTTVTILIPVWKRPQNLASLIDSIRTSLVGEDAEVATLFLASPGDEPELAELERLGCWHEVVPWDVGHGEWAKKQNLGLRLTDSEWLFSGADDLRFHPGWLRAALNVHIRTGHLVIGTNDLANPMVMRGRYATHMLIRRDYAERAVVDAPGNMFCEEYRHNCPDSEMCDTARSRGMFSVALDSHVEHLHPVFRTAPNDEVYEKGRADHARDRRLFMSRRHLWTRRIVRAHHRPGPRAIWPPR